LTFPLKARDPWAAAIIVATRLRCLGPAEASTLWPAPASQEGARGLPQGRFRLNRQAPGGENAGGHNPARRYQTDKHLLAPWHLRPDGGHRDTQRPDDKNQ